MNYNIQPIFPSAVLNANLGRELTGEEVLFIRSLSTQVKESDGNFQTLNHRVLDEAPMKDIKQFIIGGLEHYISTIICPQDNFELYITQSWINYTNPGMFHHKHNHPNSILSGVFYFNAQRGLDHIVFEHKDYERLYLISKTSNLYNAKTVTCDVKTGDLVIFPSEIPHNVPRTASDDVRVSLAFNTFVRGEFGNDDSLTHLIL